MKQYPSNRVLKKKLSKVEIFEKDAFEQTQFGHIFLHFSPETESIIKKAHTILSGFLDSTDEVSRFTSYIQLGNDDDDGLEDVGGTYDTCDNDECIEQSIIDAKENYPNQEVSSCLYANDGDHDNIERCYVCYRPLNQWLTWVSSESSYFTNEQDFLSKKLIKSSAVYLYVIFQSIPSNDVEWKPNQAHWKSFEKFKKDAYEFYEPLIKLALYINQNFK